mmetsp:Transcript_107010/g.301051  ORF Transcript_107010/g.301051 Transcript_107010/m.301051 type:complete len:379 (+) Transcript_107010:114-1250(+)
MARSLFVALGGFVSPAILHALRHRHKAADAHQFWQRALHAREYCSLERHRRAEWDLLEGYDGDPSYACSTVLPPIHPGVDYMSLIQSGDADKTIDKRITVWVNGYPRSGSSTILSMVTAAGEARKIDSRMPGKTFSLFEPCHDGDEYTPWLESQGCGRLLMGLSQCDFMGIEQLWGWRDSHTTSNNTKFTPNSARKLCLNSDITAFKTVDYGHNISDWVWFLDEQPQLRILDVVRDPRGIYASWKTTQPFKNVVGTPHFYTLTEVCDMFQANLDLNHSHVHHIVFEQLTHRPWRTMQAAYEFLGLKFGPAQRQWVRKTFNAAACPEPKPWEIGFMDCHLNSRAVNSRWRWILSDEELKTFANTASCQAVAEAYGFPLE